MLSQLAWPLLVLHLWFPLLLSAKALSRPAENIQFLLHYWLWYLGLTYIQFYVQLAPFQGLVDLGIAIFKIWLFYGHGCVLLSRFYLPKATFAATRWTSVVDMEAGFIDPMVLGFVVRNPVFQSTMSVLENSGIARFALSLFAFNHELCRLVLWPKRPLCLHLGVDFFCYMDLPRELAARLQRLERFLFGLRSAVSPAVSPSQKAHKLATKVDYSDRNEFFSPKQDFSPRDIASPNRLHTLSPPQDTTSPLMRKARRKPPEARRGRSISVGSIDALELPYPLDTAPERSVSDVIYKHRRD